MEVSEEELRQGYSKLSTEELLEILDNKFEYTELAVMVAIAELSQRKITEENIKTYKENVLNQAKEYVDRNIFYDLNLLQKHLFYFIWVPLLNFGFKQNFIDDGYVLKLKQANYYSLFGFVFFISSVMISVKFSLPTLTTLGIWILGIMPTYAFDELFNRKQLIKRLIRKHINRYEELPKEKDHSEME